MPTSSRFIQVLPSHIAQIGALVRRRREELGLTQKELAKRYNRHLNSEGKHRPITRFRIAKIEGASNAEPPAGSAKALHPAEVKALAVALELPAELFAGADTAIGAVWDPLSNPKRSRDILMLLNEYEHRSERLVGWARFLPCSLETPEFLRAHNAAVFRHIPDVEYRDRVTELFNQTGLQRRQRLFEYRPERVSDFYHLMFLPDLQRIAMARGEYRGFSASLREGCLKNLLNLVSDPGLRVHVVVAEEDDLQGAERFFVGLDNLIVFDAGLAQWRDQRGYVYWSTEPQIVQMHSSLVNTFMNMARYRSRDTVIKLLKDLCGRVGSHP